MNPAPSGAKSSEYAAPTELKYILDFVSTKMPHLRLWKSGDSFGQRSWRDKDKLDVLAMKEILARENKRK